MIAQPKVLVTCKQMQNELDVHRERIEDAGFEIVVPRLVGQQFSSSELVSMSKGVVGFIAGDDELDRNFFESAPDLRVLIRWGIGMDSVDHEAASDHEVVVRNTPGVFGQEVADLAFGYILTLARGINRIDTAIRRGEWPKFEGVSLAGMTLGIIGFGSIGKEVAKRGSGFGMNVVSYDPYANGLDGFDEVKLLDLDTVYSSSDFIVITCPSTADTFHLVDSNAFRLMKSTAFVINVARGPVIDEGALVVALASELIAGAGLDVFEYEPLDVASPLRDFPQVVLGSHNGSNTRQGVARASAAAVEYLLEELTK